MTEETIFAEALEISTPIDRTAYLDQACAGDTVLRQRIETLLKSHEADGNFLEKPAIQCAAEELAGQACAGDTQGELPADDEGVETLDFLAPSNKPGALGRLGHYEILEVIGRGGMGIVLRAVDEKLQRVVAIKVMATQLATNATARKRFTREAQAAAAVNHDHLVTIHAVEEANGLPYLVMQFVSGMSLQQRLDRDGPLQLTEIVRIGMQTAAGLAAAHAQGLIHRDIKPANILLENGVERVKITDFGLARAVADASLTQSGVVAGTPQYMSPEQARGERVDQRTDLFSLGSVLYAMCAGRPPFRATTGIAVLKRVCEDTPSPIKEINAEIPAWLAEIVTKLHGKDPADRFQSAAEVAELLNRHLAHLQHPSVVGQVSNLPVDPRAGCQLSPRRRRWATAAAVLLLCVGAGLGFTEATSVTNLRATVIRVFTPDGTLVVEVDDPDVKVTIEGDGGLVITGAGLQEVRLKPGSYKVHAAKDGKPVRLDQELVTIARGDKQVVRVRLEATGLAKATPHLVPRAVLEGHNSWVHSLAFSPDGKTLATGSNDQRVRLWDTATGNLTGQFHADDGLIEALAYSPDGTVLVSASNQSKVRVWDAATFKLLAEAKHDALVRTVAFRRGNSMLATASDDKTVKLWKWDGAVLVPVRTLGEHSSGVFAMSFNPQGTVIASATSDGMLYLWDVESGKPLKSVRLGWQGLLCLAFSPDGMTIAAGGFDKGVELRRTDTLESVGTLRGHKEWVLSLVFLPDGKTLVSAGGHFDLETQRSDRPGELKLWDVAGLKERLSVDGYEKGICSVALSADGKTLATGDFSNLGRLWDVDALLAAARARETADAGAADVLKDALLLMNFEKDTFYDKDGKTYVRDLSGRGNDGLCDNVAFTPDGKAGGGLLCQGGRLQLAKSLINRQPNYTITAWCRYDKPTPGTRAC
jgi:WD40 repeat protein